MLLYLYDSTGISVVTEGITPKQDSVYTSVMQGLLWGEPELAIHTPIHTFMHAKPYTRTVPVYFYRIVKAHVHKGQHVLRSCFCTSKVRWEKRAIFIHFWNRNIPP